MLNVGGDIFFKHLKEKILPTMKHSKHAFCKLNWAIIRYKNYPHTTNSLIGDDDALTLEDTQEDGKDSKTTTAIISRRWLIILIILIKEKINLPPLWKLKSNIYNQFHSETPETSLQHSNSIYIAHSCNSL